MARRRRVARAKWWKGKSRAAIVRVATWNVLSLVESEGSVSAATTCGRHVAEDRNIVRVVETLRRYNIDVAGLQETHWFGDSFYRVADRLVLTSGRAVPLAG